MLNLMDLIVLAFFGGLVGWVASIIMKTNGQQGLVMNIVVGVVGAGIGSWLGAQLNFGTVAGFNLGSFIVALIGAIVLLGILKMVNIQK